MTIDQLKFLFDPYDRYALECDGFTKVVTYVLRRAGLHHLVMSGICVCNGVLVSPHLWVEIDNLIIDYRLRMWIRDEAAPHGVFPKANTNCSYTGKSIELHVSDELFEILTDKTLHGPIS